MDDDNAQKISTTMQLLSQQRWQAQGCQCDYIPPSLPQCLTSSAHKGGGQGEHPAAGHLAGQEDGRRDDPKASLGAAV